MNRVTFVVAFACLSCFQPAPETRAQSAEQAIASAVAHPRPNGRVSDRANIIPADEEVRLEARLCEVFEETQSALIVVTVESLDGQEVATYTNTLARQWQVGGERGGAILLVAPNERQARIETDDTVRARLSDEQASEIMQKVLLPHFRTGNFAAGIASGVEAIASHL